MASQVLKGAPHDTLTSVRVHDMLVDMKPSPKVMLLQSIYKSLCDAENQIAQLETSPRRVDVEPDYREDVLNSATPDLDIGALLNVQTCGPVRARGEARIHQAIHDAALLLGLIQPESADQ